MAKRSAAIPPIVVIFGDEEYHKSQVRTETLNRLLPPEVDRAMALSEYDGSRPDDQGGPSVAAVFDDLATLPFLSDRRIVVISEADKFVSANRERIERYLQSPSPTGVLVLICRSFPKTTRAYKAAVAVGGQIVECKKLTGRKLVDFVNDEVRARGKRLGAGQAERLVSLVGEEQGAISAELDKLCLFVEGRATITEDDVSSLVGQSREEKVFAVTDAAAAGRLDEALRLWQQVLTSDPAAAFRAVGGIAFVLRKWLTAHQMLADGFKVGAIAPKVMMWGREALLDSLLRRVPARRLKRLLSQLANLDAQAKSGARSIERGVEAVLFEIAAPAA